MGCVHADGGNPRYVCNECEKDEPGLRVAQRGWVRGDVLPEVGPPPEVVQDSGIEHKISGQHTGESYFYVCLKCHQTWEKNFALSPSAFPKTCTKVVMDSPVGKIAVPMPDPIAAEETKPFKLPGYGDQLFTFRTVDLNTMSDYELGRQIGAQDMLRMIRSSLQAYPNAGGDIEVMKEVDRIVRTAVKESMIALENAMLKTMRKIQEEVKEKV